MPQVTKQQVQQILTDGLKLASPEFMLEKAGGRLSGNVISASFKGKRDHERQRMIWDALDAALGAESARGVGLLLAYTPAEWEMGSGDTPAAGKKKAG